MTMAASTAVSKRNAMAGSASAACSAALSIELARTFRAIWVRAGSAQKAIEGKKTPAGSWY